MTSPMMARASAGTRSPGARARSGMAGIGRPAGMVAMSPTSATSGNAAGTRRVAMMIGRRRATKLRRPPEDEYEGDGEEADRERLRLDLACVEDQAGDGKDLDRLPRELVAGEVAELPKDDEERRPDDEPGEDGVRNEPGQAARLDKPKPELKYSDEEREDEEGGRDIGLGDRGKDRVDRDREDVREHHLEVGGTGEERPDRRRERGGVEAVDGVDPGDEGEPHHLRDADEGGGRPGDDVGGEALPPLGCTGGHAPGGGGTRDIGCPSGGVPSSWLVGIRKRGCPSSPRSEGTICTWDGDLLRR
jgi:hypothetical protein